MSRALASVRSESTAADVVAIASSKSQGKGLKNTAERGDVVYFANRKGTLPEFGQG